MNNPTKELIRFYLGHYSSRNAAMADNGSSGTNATAIVAIVILVIAALFGGYYFLNSGGGSGGSDIDANIDLNLPKPGDSK